jgi:DNA-binding MarR family transcriptional regulator
MLAKKRKIIKKEKSPKQLERHLKGVANHRRIEILFLVADNQGITVDDISERLNCNMKTISGHIWRLSQAGLINKSYRGHAVTHELSPYGKTLHKFLVSFSRQ